MLIEDERAYKLWCSLRKGIMFLLWILIYGLTIFIGRIFGLELNREVNFGLLVVLTTVALAIVFFSLIELFLFGRREKGSWPPWLKIVIPIVVIFAIGFAIWDGIDTRRRDLAPPQPSLSQLMQEGKL